MFPNLGIFIFFTSFLQQGIFEGADFKYDNIFYQLPAQKSFLVKNTIKPFLFLEQIFDSNLGIFIFSQNFAIRQIWGCWSQIWQYCFQIPAQKCRNKAFLDPNLGIFIISWKFTIRQIRRCWFQMWQYCFQFQHKNVQKRHFWFQI